MKYVIALLAFLLPGAAMAADAPTNDPAIVAEVWAAVLDRQDYAASWNAATPEFRKGISQAQWAQTLTKTRAPFGAVSRRILAAVTHPKSLPGMPAGEYTIVQFASTFAKKADAIETVVMVSDAGVPKVAGYFIR